MVVFVSFLVWISPYLRRGVGEIFIHLYFFFFFRKCFTQKSCFSSKLIREERAITNIFLLMETPKPPEFRQICQTKEGLCRISPIHQKSARNWEPTRNIFCQPDDFQIRQNFQNLADKSAIWQRWAKGRGRRQAGTADGNSLRQGGRTEREKKEKRRAELVEARAGKGKIILYQGGRIGSGRLDWEETRLTEWFLKTISSTKKKYNFFSRSNFTQR
jgi:hypothetical protein